jgi:hypothetical protein
MREAFAIHERGAPELRAIRNEPEGHQSVVEAGEALEASLAALIDATVEPSRITPADRGVVARWSTLGTWHALRDQGLRPAGAFDAVSRMLAARWPTPRDAHARHAAQMRATSSCRRRVTTTRAKKNRPSPAGSSQALCRTRTGDPFLTMAVRLGRAAPCGRPKRLHRS